MSGICGVVFRDKDFRSNVRHLMPMIQALDVLSQGDSFTLCLGSVMMGAQKFSGRLAGVAEMTVHGEPLALAFHGSLYNLRELFPSQKQDSDPFMGILGLYVKEGIAFLQQLRGEFALAVWEGHTKTLYLATDRFRVHPLFYYQDHDKLVFASRMKGIAACPFSVERTIDPEAIVDVVASSAILTPRTIFREVRKLPPGHVLIYQNGEIRLTPYWEINFLHSDGVKKKELAQRLRGYLTDAVSIRVAGDGPSDRIGTFLSGGVDSSTVTGILSRLGKNSLKSFSIGFNEDRFNEINYARIAARTFGTEHYEHFVTPQDTCNAIPVLLEAFDEPFANASTIPTYFCAKLAREHGVKFLYAGDGGDELFAGNERYATERLFEYYQVIPRLLRKLLLQPLVFALADRLGWEFFMKGKKYIQRATIPYPERLSSYGFLKIVSIIELLEGSVLEVIGKGYNPYAAVDYYYHRAPARSELDRQLYIDLKLAISDNDLFKVTKMTEAAGICVRFPFLDHRLVEFSAAIPAPIKMQGRRLRSFFKDAYADLLPREIRAKKKHGFGLPIPIWLRTDKRLNELMQDLVLSPRTIQRGYFQKKTLEMLVERHKTDESSFYGTALWNLMVLELWLRRYSEAENVKSPQLT